MNKLNKNKWRTNVCVRIFKIILPATILISATTANAAVCSPDVSSSLKQAQYNAMKQDAAQLEPVAKNFMDNINQSLETIGCTDAWPVGNLGISLPSVDLIIKKTKEAAISKACSIAREKVAQLTGNISESISIDMPVLGNIANGSVSAGTGYTSGSAATVNGNDVWSSISNSMK
ncbi:MULTISPECIES: hypothetical protein [Klebsiella]|uniref:hypothetical protein n=1 Tax=Klebsiella TaxID=570 RepID=UPI001BCB66AD|nr:MULTISPECIES: hypothetical protein [Klebsiella]MBZ4207634.1 hypothetical protein [Klebsiella aerogenes]MBZ4214890.1 hypothetical protein [Klebsiella aerogenes]MBZ5780786.1 hypothetical protein [Klebsiella aerogenes]QVJ10612.1 hypothetical protein KGA69_03485 [Klebsiella sp. A52]